MVKAMMTDPSPVNSKNTMILVQQLLISHRKSNFCGCINNRRCSITSHNPLIIDQGIFCLLVFVLVICLQSSAQSMGRENPLFMRLESLDIRQFVYTWMTRSIEGGGVAHASRLLKGYIYIFPCLLQDFKVKQRHTNKTGVHQRF